MDLKKLQNKAKDSLDKQKLNEQQQSDESSSSGKKRRRPANYRIGMWIIEFLVLLFVLEHFVISPYLKKQEQESDKQKKEEQQKKVKLRGRQISPLQKTSRNLPGLTVADKVYLAPVKQLAKGGEDARSIQFTVSRKKGLPIEVVNSIGMHFRLVPSGTFMMGSPEDEKYRNKGEKLHVSEIKKPFYLGKFEVTQEQWNAVMDDNPSGFDEKRHPVEEVTWNDCQEFLKKLCRKEDLPEDTYRLPTEAEWEYACRAGTQAAYYFGDNPEQLSDFAIYKANSYGSTHKVGTVAPNAYGLYNMLGNVWEWCQTKYYMYPGTVEYKSMPDWRVIRGGNWYLEAEKCRAANRSRLGRGSHGNMLGFRVVRELNQ